MTPTDTFASHLSAEPNLSLAWARAFMRISGPPLRELSPLLMTFTGLSGDEPDELPELKAALDYCLVESGLQQIQTVANTIFPESLWRRAKGNRDRFYANYLENLPAYVEMSSKNKHGLYFARLIAFDVDPKTGNRLARLPEDKAISGGNQLEFIIQRAKSGVRRSMFQASVFDPARDHTGSALQGFPCLQHLTFVPDFARSTLQVNAFYATQYVFERAYGNLLGVARLGNFMAREMGLTLERASCFVGIEQMGKTPPAKGKALDTLHKLARAALGVSTGPDEMSSVQGAANG
jgi:hypothetical protein